MSPANSLVQHVGKQTKRVVVNREPVGEELGLRFGDGGDLFLGGDCDSVFLDIIQGMGWLPRLSAVRDRLPEANQKLLDEVMLKAEKRAESNEDAGHK